MKQRLLSLLPSRERLHSMRWLRWLGPYLHHPRLWHINRKGLALGLALGVFFGLLIPVAQIPASATLAVLLRANLPVAVASTLVTNPVTFGPVYFGAYKLGEWVLGTEPRERMSTGDGAVVVPTPGPTLPEGATDDRPWWAWLVDFWEWTTDVGKPLVVGLTIIATVMGVLMYLLVQGIWIVKVRLTRRRRQRRRTAQRRSASG